MKLAIHQFRLSVALIALIVLMMTPTRSQVNVTLGVGIGAIFPTSDFGGSTSDFYNGSRYGLTSGPNIQGKAKIGFTGWSLTTEIDYSSLSNSGNSEPGQGEMELSQTNLSLKVGPEICLNLPVVPIALYIGANLAVNRFSGKTSFQGVASVPSATYTMDGATRFGIGFSAGTEVSIGSLLSLDFNISYNLLNLFGKEWNDVNPGSNQRIDSYLSLNDNRDPQYVAGDDKHFISNQRSMSSVVFSVSVLFGW